MAATTVDTLQVRITANAKQLQSGLAGVKGQLSGLNKQAGKMSGLDKFKGKVESMKPAFQKMALVGTVAFAGIALGINKAIKAAASAEKIQNNFETTFGGATKAVGKFTKDFSEQFGFIETDLKKATMGIGFQLNAIGGMTDKEMTSITKNLTTASAGLVDFFDDGRDVVDISGAMAKAIAGSNQQLIEMGFNVREADIKTEAYSTGIAKTGEELTRTQRAQALTNMIVEQSTGSVEGLTKNLDTQQSKLRFVKKAQQELAENIGTAFLPAMKSILDYIGPIIADLSEWAKKHQTLTAIIGGGALILAGLVAVLGFIGLALPGLITAFTFLAGAIAPVTLAVLALTAVLLAVKLIIDAVTLSKDNAALAANRLTTATELEEQATQDNSDAKQRLVELVDEAADAKLAMTDASLALMRAEDREKEAQDKLNVMVANGITSGRDYKKAQLKLEAAHLRVGAAQDLAKTSTATYKGKLNETDRMTWKYISSQKKGELASLAQAGKYDEVSKALQEMSDNTGEYKDESGKMVKLSKDDAEDMALFIGDALSKTTSGYKDFWDKSQESVETAISAAKKSRESFVSAGKGFSSGISSGINANSWMVSNSARNTARQANAAFRNEIDAHSPSRLMAKAGGDFSAGIALGIKGGVGSVVKATEGLSIRARDSLTLPGLGDMSGTTGKASLSQDTSPGGMGGRSQPINLTVKVGEDTLINKVIKGINNQSYMNNETVLEV